jgi:beta-mannanase
MDIEFPNPDWNIPHDLDGAWDQGAVPFVNLAVGTAGLGPRTAQDVADGVIDEAIRQWARIFADWSQGGAKRAFIAPLQEMNANWVSYGLDPENYKAAYTRIQGIFAEEGVPGEAVLWVFAPNGWSEPGQEFERYYPGDEVVDVVGFSAFNFGACVASGEGWDSYEEAIEPYMERMERMAPEKPIFLAQTGTVEVGGDKGEWLVDTFQKLSEVGNFRGLIYFNVSKQEAGAPSCNPVDWRVYNPEEGSGDGGFIEAILALGGGAAPLPSNQVFIPMVVH